MAYTVARRTREIGIRMALGAMQGSVIWMVMREVLVLVAIGVGVGVPAALGLTRLVRNQLYGLTPHDPSTLAMATHRTRVRRVRGGLHSGPARQPHRSTARLALRMRAVGMHDQSADPLWNNLCFTSGQNSLSTCETASMPTCSTSFSLLSQAVRLSG